MQVTDCELIPGGRTIRVTEENKHEYVDRVAEHRLTTAIRPQINAFMEGFNELIPRELISIFNDKEFELLISGLPDIDCELEDLIQCSMICLDLACKLLILYLVFSGRFKSKYRVFWLQHSFSSYSMVLGNCPRIQQGR